MALVPPHGRCLSPVGIGSSDTRVFRKLAATTGSRGNRTVLRSLDFVGSGKYAWWLQLVIWANLEFNRGNQHSFGFVGTFRTLLRISATAHFHFDHECQRFWRRVFSGTS